jgi:hypothetical protein
LTTSRYLVIVTVRAILGGCEKAEKERSAGEDGGGFSMGDCTNVGSAFKIVAIYMAVSVFSSVLGFMFGVISGAVVAGARGSLIGGILGALLAAWLGGRLLSHFSR